jgi:hypothetical protein
MNGGWWKARRTLNRHLTWYSVPDSALDSALSSALDSVLGLNPALESALYSVLVLDSAVTKMGSKKT